MDIHGNINKSHHSKYILKYLLHLVLKFKHTNKNLINAISFYTTIKMSIIHILNNNNVILKIS